MQRTTLINLLLAERGGTRYLEIGGGRDDGNFGSIVAQHKVGVDVGPSSTFQGGSDAFFVANNDDFDVILIDGVHVEDQVVRDIANAQACLAPYGAVVLHDCLPPDAWYQRPADQYVEGQNWNGAVWKATLREFNRSVHHCVAVATDWGCGVIDTAHRQRPACRLLPADLDYERHYAFLQEHAISVADFVRERVKVFYHLACIGDWEPVFVEQMRALQHQRFASADVTVLAGAEDQAVVDALCEEHGFGVSIVFRDADLQRFEAPALLAIEDYAREHEGYVLYLHAKGVSNTADENKARWRRLMMDELVEQSDRCLRELPYYDAIGVNWREMPPISHFCGNFWYASTDYLRTLAPFEGYYDQPRYRIWDPINDKRLGCEFWIGSGREPRVLSLVCRNEDFCNPGVWQHSSYGLATA